MAVHISSRMRTSSATSMAASVLMASPLTDMRNPPSRPPSCSGMKKSMLAKRVVKARMRMQSAYDTWVMSTRSTK